MSKIKLNHIGIATDGSQTSLDFFKLLGMNVEKKEEVGSQKVSVEFLPLDNNCNLELLASTDPSGPIAKYIDKKGPGIHHLCLEVSGVDQLLIQLKNSGVRLINEFAVDGADNCKIAFVHPHSTGGILIELSEKNK